MRVHFGQSTLAALYAASITKTSLAPTSLSLLLAALDLGDAIFGVQAVLPVEAVEVHPDVVMPIRLD